MSYSALRHIKAVKEVKPDQGRIKVFLGGSIELGKAELWQEKLVEHFSLLPQAELLDIYNPRRGGAWDPAWMENYEQGPFREQVNWELNHQKDADLLIYFFAANTISPITLFELGLFHQKSPLIGVDPAYKRIGNLMITKEHFDLDIHIGWDTFLVALDKRLHGLSQNV